MSDEDYITEEPAAPDPATTPKRKRVKGKDEGKKADKLRSREANVRAPVAAPVGNPRRGRLKPGPPDQPAEFVPGEPAQPPAFFDPKALCESFGLWWMNGDGENYLRALSATDWIMLQSRALQDDAQMFFRGKVSFVAGVHDYGVSQYRQLLMFVRNHRRVEEVMPGLAGYPAGPHRVGGDLVLVKSGRTLPLAVKGEFPIIRALLDSRLSRNGARGETLEIDQNVLFDLWCKVAYEAQRDCKPGMPRRGHALVLAGANNSGKSFIQEHLITPLLGGRQADPKMFLQGNDSYNSDVLGAEHLALGELAMPSSKMDARNELKERLKALVANTSHRMRCMRTEPLTVAPNWAFSQSINSNQDSLKNFPMLEKAFADKILMLKVESGPMPMPTTTEDERRAFRDAITKELPAYIYYLTEELVIPAALKVYSDGADATRFGFREFQHPSLVAQLFDDTPQAQLRDMIDAAWFTSFEDKVKLWDLPSPGNCETLSGQEAAALGDINISQTARLWQGNHTWLHHLLSGTAEGWSCSLAKDYEKWSRYNSLSINLKRLMEEPDQERFYNDNTKVLRKASTDSGTRVENLRWWKISGPIG